MEPKTLTPALRLHLQATLATEMAGFESERVPCYETYPSRHILRRLDLQCLVSFVGDAKSMFQQDIVNALLASDAQDYFEQHACNEYNAYLLLGVALARAWRLPMSKGDLRRAIERLCAQCPDQELLKLVQSGDFRALSGEQMARAKRLGIVVDALWCSWMELWEVVNPLFLPT